MLNFLLFSVFVHQTTGNCASDPGPYDRTGHWDASSTGAISSTDGKVVSWRDESGNGFELAAPTLFRPDEEANVFNDVSAVYFSSCNFLQSASVHPTYGASPFTWILLVKLVNAQQGYTNIFSTNDAIGILGASNTRRRLFSHNPISMSSHGMHGWSPTQDFIPDWSNSFLETATYVYTHRWNGVDSFMIRKLNLATGVVVSDTSAGNPQNYQTYVYQGGVVMGRGMQNNNHCYSGYIAEAMAYTYALSDDQLYAQEAYLKSKWNNAAMHNQCDPNGVATCESFSCPHDSLNKGSDEPCTGNADTCNADTCCNPPATCDTHTTCLHPTLNKGAIVSCDGDQTTCDDTRCCKANCGNDFTCSDPFYTKNLGTSKPCAGDSTTCNVETCCEGDHCGFTEWGDGLPFSSGGVTLDGSDTSNIKINFGVQTQSCVDRKNWLKATLHKLGTPVCQEKDKTADNGCAALSTDEGACNDKTECQYRIPCDDKLADANLAPFTVNPDVKTRNLDSPTQDTEFEISIKTEKLAQATAVYSQPSQDDTKAKLEFCVRPAVKVSDTTILFREIVLRVHIDMDGSFSDLEIASDSFQDDAVQEVDNTLALTATAFACKLQDGSNNVYEQFAANNVPALTPNQVFTLCVVPSSIAIQCDDIVKLTFKQDRSNQPGGQAGFFEDRIKDGNPQNTLLTSNPTTTTVEVVDNSGSTPVTTKYSGCVVSSRLEAAYFAAVSPNPIQMSGSALLGFKPASSGRKLREQSSMALVIPGQRHLQEAEQVASFNVQIQLSKNQDNTESNNSVQIDAAANVAWYYLTSALAAIAASIMI